jgi:hypothetical protein
MEHHMELPNTFMSIHAIDRITASTGPALGAPLVLAIEGEYGTAQLTLFFRDEDEDYTRRLIEAINGVQRRPRAICPLEQAAYAAEGIVYVYQGSER